MSSKQFNNQVGEIMRAAFYLQEAGFFCTMTYHTEGATVDPVDHCKAFVRVAVYQNYTQFIDHEPAPILSSIVYESGNESAAGIARQMEALLP